MTVDIHGDGYSASCDVEIRVTRPNGSVVHGDGSSSPVRTRQHDGSGTLTTTHPQRHRRRIHRRSPRRRRCSLAFTTFTDSAATDCFRSAATGNWNSLLTGSATARPARRGYRHAYPECGRQHDHHSHGHKSVSRQPLQPTSSLWSPAYPYGQRQPDPGISNGAGDDITVNGIAGYITSGYMTLAASASATVAWRPDIGTTGLLNGNGGIPQRSPRSTSTRPRLRNPHRRRAHHGAAAHDGHRQRRRTGNMGWRGHHRWTSP